MLLNFTLRKKRGGPICNLGLRNYFCPLALMKALIKEQDLNYVTGGDKMEGLEAMTTENVEHMETCLTLVTYLQKYSLKGCFEFGRLFDKEALHKERLILK